MSESENPSSDGSKTNLIPDLPNEIALSCIARVPRSSHPYLQLVSRSWRSLLRYPVFYDVRSRLNSIQPFIYITVRARDSSSFHWLINSFSFQWLMIDPHAPNPKKLCPLPPPPFPFTGSATAVLGPRIFVIGGGSVPSSAVWIFDARFNRWEMGPNMSVSRNFVAAGALDGKVYVLGGCPVDSSAQAEVFDPAVGSWAPVPSATLVQGKRMRGSAVLGGKLFAKANDGVVAYDPAADSTAAWTNLWTELNSGWFDGAAAVNEILYCCDYHLGKIRGYDLKEDKWEVVEGIELPKFLSGPKLADVGGRLFAAWVGMGRGKDIEIGCAEIEVVRESGGGLKGSIVWADFLDLAVPRGSAIVNCLAVGL